MNSLFSNQIESPIGSFSVDSVIIPELDTNKSKSKFELSCTDFYHHDFFGEIKTKISNKSIDNILDSPNIIYDELIKTLKSKLKLKEISILGLYYPQQTTIEYFNPKKYIEIIKLHERFHALHHLTKDPISGDIWKDFNKAPAFYIELLAQLFTFHYCRGNSVLMDLFKELNEHQSFIYQSWMMFEEFTQEEIKQLYWEIRERLVTKKSMGWLGEIYKFIDKTEKRKDYKLGTFHGKLNPEANETEAILRNTAYLIGNLKIKLTNSTHIGIRIIGYEVPLGNKYKRIDLVGYDSSFNLWIIELKCKDSNDKLNDVIEQVQGYQNIIIHDRLLPEFEKEIKNKLFWKEFEFSV